MLRTVDSRYKPCRTDRLSIADQLRMSRDGNSDNVHVSCQRRPPSSLLRGLLNGSNKSIITGTHNGTQLPVLELYFASVSDAEPHQLGRVALYRIAASPNPQFGSMKKGKFTLL